MLVINVLRPKLMVA